MSVLVRAFKKSDLKEIDPIESLASENMTDEFAQAIEDSSLAVTGVRDGKVVGCGGVHPINEFQGEIWLRLDKDCLNHKIDTLRWIKCGMKIIEETYPFQQLDAMVQCCLESSIKMLEWMGFVRIKEEDDWIVFQKDLA